MDQVLLGKNFFQKIQKQTVMEETEACDQKTEQEAQLPLTEQRQFHAFVSS